MPTFFLSSQLKINCSREAMKSHLKKTSCSAKIFFLCQSSLLEDNVSLILSFHHFCALLLHYLIFQVEATKTRIVLPLLHMNTPYIQTHINTIFPCCDVWFCSSEFIIFIKISYKRAYKISLWQFQGLINKTWYFIDLNCNININKCLENLQSPCNKLLSPELVTLL